MNSPVSSEICFGAAEVAEELFGSNNAANMRRVYYWTRVGRIPVFHIGREICGRRTELRQHFARLQSRAA